MTRDDRPEGRPTDGVGPPRQDTPRGSKLSPSRGAVVRLTGDLEALAVDLLDRLGPAASTALALALLALAGEVVAR